MASRLMLNSKLTSQSFTVSANPKCGNCNKTVYAMEQQKGAGKIYHKLCFKCQLCNSKIEPGSETERGGKLACKNCGNATEGFRGAGSANVASFVSGDVRPSGGRGHDGSGAGGGAPAATSGGGGASRFCGNCGGQRTGTAAFCSQCGNKY